MPRPSIRPGEYGKITTTRVDEAGTVRYRASTRFRDRADTKTVTLSRVARTIAAAENAVKRGVEDSLDRLEQVKTDADASRRTVRNWLLEFRDGLTEADDWKRKTIADYRTTVSALLAEPLLPLRSKSGETAPPRPRTGKHLTLSKQFDQIADRALPQVTSADLKRILRDIARTNGSGTATRVRAILSHVWEMARDGGAGVDNEVRKLRDSSGTKVIPASKRQSSLEPRRAPTDDEVKKLLAALRADPAAGPMTGSRKQGVNGKDLVDLTEFLCATGCRLGEALAIEWRDLALAGNRPEVHVAKTLTYIPGEGVTLQHAVGDEPGTKTWAGTRAIPLGPSIIAVLRNRARHQGVELDSSRPVFGSPQRPHQHRDPINCRAAIRELYTKHGIEWGRSHIGRKYTVNYLLENGATVDEVARVLGWSSLATVDQYVDTSRRVNDRTRALMAR